MAMMRCDRILAMSLAVAITGAAWSPPAARGQVPKSIGEALASEKPEGRTLSPKEIYHRLLLSTCWVLREVQVGSESNLSSGTGWVIDTRQRLIITNDHVVADVDSVRIFFPAMKDDRVVGDPKYYLEHVEPIAGTVVDRSPQRDLAIIQLSSLPPTARLVPRAAESPEPGDRVYTIAAFAEGDEDFWDFTSGSVRQVGRRHLANGQLARVVETDLAFNRGNSGGPMVNDRGELVAVVEGYRADARLVSLSIAADEVSEFFSQCDRLVEPKTASDFLTRAQRRLAQGRYDVAIVDYAEALRREPALAAAKLGRGLAFLGKKDYQTALTDFEDALRQDPEEATAYLGRGICRRELGRYSESIADLSDAIRRQPNQARLYDQRASSYRRAGQFERSLSDLDRAVRLDPGSIDIRGHRGEIHRILRQYAEAAADLEVCVKSQPQNTRWLIELGVVYLDRKNYDACVSLNTFAIGVNEREPKFYNNRGAAYLGLNRLDEALKDFARAIDLKPDYALAYGNAGRVLTRAGAYQKALSLFGKAIALNTRDVRFYLWRADCEAAMGELAAAQPDRRTAGELRGQQRQSQPAVTRNDGSGFVTSR
jgi:tetratricopeptide (TPR) repeat protein